ncbi:MAG: DUF4097 family beta strand repeat-containing protein [Acidobacteriota bacterium]
MYAIRARLIVIFIAIVAYAASSLAATRIEKEWPLAGTGTVTVNTSEGSIEVVGSDRKTVHLLLTADISDFDAKFVVTYNIKPDSVAIQLERKGSGWGFWGRMVERGPNMKFKLEVPRELTLNCDTSGGPVSASSLEGAITLHTSGGPITISDIAGKVDAETSGGPIDASKIDGTASLHTSGGPISVESISGDLRAETSGGPIRIEGAGGVVDAHTSGGGVDVTLAKGNAKGGSIESSGGGINVALDATVDLTLIAETSAGRVQNDLGAAFQGTNDRDELQGKLNRGGATLRISTSAGGVRLTSL